MPHDVITRVNDIGQSQGQPSLLTFQDRHGNSIGEDDPDFSPPDEITGVPDTEINAQDASDINPVPATTTSEDQQGGYKFMNLRTGKRITRRKWTTLPMPQDVIARVNDIGQSQGQPSLLTF